jgi:hypothetical protein
MTESRSFVYSAALSQEALNSRSEAAEKYLLKYYFGHDCSQLHFGY